MHPVRVRDGTCGFWCDDAVAGDLPRSDRDALATLLARRPAEDAYARADELLAMRDRLGLGIGVDPDMARQVSAACRYVLWSIADEPAATPADVPHRERLFARHAAADADDLLPDVLARALTRDRRRHGLDAPGPA